MIENKLLPKLDYFIVDGVRVRRGDPNFEELEKKYCKEIILTKKEETDNECKGSKDISK